MKSRAPIYAGIAIVAIIVGFLSAQFSTSMHPTSGVALLNGTMLPEARALPAFELVNQHNEPFGTKQLKGHWSIMFFGYTNCPDVCPTTLATLARVDKQLASLPAAQHPQVVFVSVDPKRDTVKQLNNYVTFFSPAFIGLTGEQAQLDTLTHGMGVPVVINDTGNGTYTVDHAATMFLINPDAGMTAVFSPPHDVNNLTNDIKRIIAARS